VALFIFVYENYIKVDNFLFQCSFYEDQSFYVINIQKFLKFYSNVNASTFILYLKENVKDTNIR
jgi:hypothetical protein